VETKIIMQDEYLEQIEILVARYQNAEGPLMKLANFAGSNIDSIMSHIPDGIEIKVEKAIKIALEKAYDASGTLRSSALTPEVPPYFHKIAATFSGAVGGAAGLPGAVAEFPITITTMFSSFQKIAQEYGFDSDNEKTKLECIKVFTMGGPLGSDEELDLSFVTAKFSLSGQVVSSLISNASQKVALMVTQKLGSQAIPIIGAVTGSALNYTFISFYQEMAHIRFNLKKMQVENKNRNPLSDFTDFYNQGSIKAK
tara:strand:- start:5 stop:769 length:765 start_codon:yes stop_codon:yes gene_type:complete